MIFHKTAAFSQTIMCFLGFGEMRGHKHTSLPSHIDWDGKLETWKALVVEPPATSSRPLFIFYLNLI